jgi:outer membrane biosynthesis protein TonB
MAKFCSGCGAQVQEGSKFCTSCGQTLAAPQWAPAQAEKPLQPPVQQQPYIQPGEQRQQVPQPAVRPSNQVPQPQYQPPPPYPPYPQYAPAPAAKKANKNLFIIGGAGVLIVALIVVGIFTKGFGLFGNTDPAGGSSPEGATMPNAQSSGTTSGNQTGSLTKDILATFTGGTYHM